MTASSDRSKPLAGRVAIVTGGGSGIGRAEAIQLAEAGAKVVVNDLNRGEPTRADLVVREIVAAGGEAVAANHSVSTMAGAAAIVATAVDAFGRLDILMNTAGFGRVAPIYELSEADWDAVIAVNLKGTLATIRHAAPIFMAQNSGVIVNTSSESALGDYDMSCYAAAKEGVVGLTRAVARDLGRYNIRCNAVRPRAFDTGQAKAESWQFQVEFERTYGRPMTGSHRWGHTIQGTAAEVAAIAAWLCTDDAASVTGRVFLAGCGEVGLWDEPKIVRSSFRPDGWDLASLSRVGAYMLGGLENETASLPEEAWQLIRTRAEASMARQRAAKLAKQA